VNRRIASGCLCILLMLAPAAAPAATVAGISIPGYLRTHAGRLELASCGVRRTLWIEHYVAALYLPRGASVQALPDARTPKAVLLHIVDARYLPGEIPGKWAHVLDREIAPRAMTRVRRLYRKLTDGDILTMVYQPRRGTAMRFNGALIARVRGHALVRAILDTWADEEPLADKLHELAVEHRC
jgi:hypothetical protein